MTESEFTAAAAALRSIALDRGKAFLKAEEAEDVAQETMIRLWAIHLDLQSELHARKLTNVIARHLAIDRLRQKHMVSLTEVHLATAESGSQSPESLLEERENEAWLRQKLSHLPATEYQVLRLRQVERKTNSQIAAILGIQQASVEVLLSNARHKLLKAIERRVKS